MKKKKTVKKKKVTAGKRVRRVLSTKEPKPFRIENEKGQGRGLIICDHASARIPKSLKDMGLKKAELNRHIGWDIGAEEISRYLSKKLDMPAVLANYSRLVVDLNRAPDHPECMAEVSDGTVIPANAGLSRPEKARRLKEVFWPYQKQVGKQIDRQLHKKRIPILLAIHSYTPEMGGKKRPWHIAILWNRQEKIAKTVISGIRRNYPGLLVGENEPYSLKDGRFKNSTIDCHGERRGLPYVFVEFRQDLVDTKEKAAYWGEVFLRALYPILEDPNTFHIEKPKKKK